MFGDRCYFRHGCKSPFQGIGFSLLGQNQLTPSCLLHNRSYITFIFPGSECTKFSKFGCNGDTSCLCDRAANPGLSHRGQVSGCRCIPTSTNHTVFGVVSRFLSTPGIPRAMPANNLLDQFLAEFVWSMGPSAIRSDNRERQRSTAVEFHFKTGAAFRTCC
jgi:hypothetical protein